MSESIFIDTSAFYALMDRSDQFHVKAASVWPSLLGEGISLQTGNYIVIETLALIQNRLGFDAANMWYRDVLAVVELIWTEEALHWNAFDLWLSFGRRKLSLVDCVSFILMRKKRIEKVFAFDRHFLDHGFEIIPR